MKRNVGRPIEKENRKKIGLSVDGMTNDYISELSTKTGKNKSKIVEEAIALFYEDYKIKEKEYEDFKKNKEQPYNHFKEMLSKSLSS